MQLRIQDFRLGAPIRLGVPTSDADAFQWKHVKMKEFGSVGGGPWGRPLDPPVLLTLAKLYREMREILCENRN